MIERAVSLRDGKTEDGDQVEGVDAVAAASDAALYASWLLAAAVDEARADGATWEDVGRVLGISRQAAQQRWGSTTT